MSALYNGLQLRSYIEDRDFDLGSGIYFYDDYEKAISFSTSIFDSSSKRFYIILAEVGLGKIHKCTARDSGKKVKTDCNSIKGKGRRIHDKYQRIFLSNGCMVPAGDLIDTNKIQKRQKKCRVNLFDYNKYVVFDPSQVRIRYLLELENLQDSE
jgi:hypothetical protein